MPEVIKFSIFWRESNNTNSITEITTPLVTRFGGGRKNVTVQYFFAFPPPHFSKILENWRGGEKKSNKCCGRISQVFDPPPPFEGHFALLLRRGGGQKTVNKTT